jgi:hypothetical protein
MTNFSLEVFQNEYIPAHFTTMDAVVTISAQGLASPVAGAAAEAAALQGGAALPVTHEHERHVRQQPRSLDRGGRRPVNARDTSPTVSVQGRRAVSTRANWRRITHLG